MLRRAFIGWLEYSLEWVEITRCVGRQDDKPRETYLDGDMMGVWFHDRKRSLRKVHDFSRGCEVVSECRR